MLPTLQQGHLKRSGCSLPPSLVDRAHPPFFCCAGLQYYAPVSKHVRNRPLTCQRHDHDSGGGKGQRSASGWPSPRAKNQASAQATGARAPSQKIHLRMRTRGWEGCLGLWVARGHQRAAQKPTSAPTSQEPPPRPRRRPHIGNLGGLPSRPIPKPRSAGECARHRGRVSLLNTRCARDGGHQQPPPMRRPQICTCSSIKEWSGG